MLEHAGGDPRVTVVIATRNRRDELLRTLGHLERLHPRSPIVVVDNASSDGTVAALRRDFPTAQVVPLPRNEGAAARNVGVAQVRTPYVAFNDDDSWWGGGALRRVTATLDAHPQVGLVAARTLVGPEEQSDPVNALMAGSPLSGRPGLPGPRILGFLACSVVVRRDAFTDAGGFSSLLFFVGEETLLAYDLAAAGWELAYVEDAIVHHHPSRARAAGGGGRGVLKRRNALLIAWMRRPLRAALGATQDAAAAAVRDPAARAGLAGAAVQLSAALSRRRPLPPDVERDVRRLDGSDSSGPRRYPHAAHWSGPPPDSAPDGEARATVVVMTRDRRDELLRTLDHMTRLPDGCPIVVVDNGSTDGAAGAVAAQHPDVTVLRGERNLGALARNVAVRDIATPYVAFCDDDSWWDPGALTRAADLLDAHPGLGSVTGRILVEPGGREDPITPELRDSPVPGPSWLPGPALLGIMAGASMLRVRSFEDAGGFSPRLWLGGEEELLTIDLAVLGWWACWAEDVVVHHRASTARDPRARRRLGIRNTLWTTWLRRPGSSALRRTATVLRSLPADRTSLAAVGEAVTGLSWVLRERRVVPAEVEHRLRLLEEPQRRSAARRYVDSSPSTYRRAPGRRA